LRIDAALIDAAGAAGVFDAVVAFCNARIRRRVLAGKGAAGFARPAITSTRAKKGRLFIVGVDPLKTQIVARLARGQSVRFSHTLESAYFEQLCSERRVVRMSRGRPVARFERKVGYQAEALDCFVYALAAKAALSLNSAAFAQREGELNSETPPKPPPNVYRSAWMER
jgi:phage terminase large subunit GpA-like protein